MHIRRSSNICRETFLEETYIRLVAAVGANVNVEVCLLKEALLAAVKCAGIPLARFLWLSSGLLEAQIRHVSIINNLWHFFYRHTQLNLLIELLAILAEPISSVEPWGHGAHLAFRRVGRIGLGGLRLDVCGTFGLDGLHQRVDVGFEFDLDRTLGRRLGRGTRTALHLLDRSSLHWTLLGLCRLDGRGRELMLLNLPLLLIAGNLNLLWPVMLLRLLLGDVRGMLLVLPLELVALGSGEGRRRERLVLLLVGVLHRVLWRELGLDAQVGLVPLHG